MSPLGQAAGVSGGTGRSRAPLCGTRWWRTRDVTHLSRPTAPVALMDPMGFGG